LTNLSRLWNVAEHFEVYELSDIVAAKFATICEGGVCDIGSLVEVVNEVYGNGYSTFIKNFPDPQTDGKHTANDNKAVNDNSSITSQTGSVDDNEDLEQYYDQAETYLANETGISCGRPVRINLSSPDADMPSSHSEANQASLPQPWESSIPSRRRLRKHCSKSQHTSQVIQ
jgi:hypothetical protein